MEILTAIFAALAIFVLTFALVTPSRAAGSIKSRLGRFEREAPSQREADLSRPFIERVGIPTFRRLEFLATRPLPGTVIRGIERKLLLAGEPASVFAFLTIQLIAVLAGIALAVAAVANGLERLLLIGALAGSALFALAPMLWLMNAVAKRKDTIRKALADAVDLIVTTVEAGMAIDASLAEVGRETPGPLGEELRIAVRETTLGRSRRDALSAVVDRTDVPELRMFIQAVVQAEQTGIPIGPVLRTQASQLRLKRRQRAETEAQRAPVKMVVVLGTMVLPALVLFVMGPAVLRILDTI